MNITVNQPIDVNVEIAMNDRHCICRLLTQSKLFKSIVKTFVISNNQYLSLEENFRKHLAVLDRF
jgi:thermostable 8-oxoguanine DNA glycosylase